ncbi:MAG: RidA family protein [Acidimicrobiales bacterium]|nr:RidA family protein [Acidimicrobiales bacterium]
MTEQPLGSIDNRLAALGLSLPGPFHPPEPARAVIVHGGAARTSGQLPRNLDGKVVHPGVVGVDVSVEHGAEAARWCVLNALSVLRDELGSLDRIERVLHLTVYVASASESTAQPGVADGASRFLVEVFGEAGRHTRTAVGVVALPRGACVEIELVVALRD